MKIKYKIKNILGLDIADVTLSNIVPIMVDMIEVPEKKTFFLGNIHNLSLYKKNKEFEDAMNKASLVYPDGKGLIFASKILGEGLSERTNFLDFVFEFLKYAESKKWSLYFLGGTEKVSKAAIANLKSKFPTLSIHGPNSYFKIENSKEVIAEINKTKSEILFVSMGSPKQEIWISKHMHEINAKAFFGTGGSIDVIAGRVPRAPKWMHSNLESVHRIYKEPKRLFGRYLVDSLRFAFHVLVQVLYNTTHAK